MKSLVMLIFVFLLYFVINMVGDICIWEIFVFLLYFVINMVGDVGVGSVVMSVAVLGLWSL